MVVKNIYIEAREYLSLDGLKLMPGEAADLSRFSSKRLTDCQELQNDFVRGYCVCIGKGVPQEASKEEFLKEARNRALGIERRPSEIKISGKPKTIPPKLTSFDKRSVYSKLDKVLKDKQEKEYKEEFPNKKKPEVIEQEATEARLVVIDPLEGRISISSVPKQTVIDLEPFKDDIQTREHYTLPKPNKQDVEVQEILERIKDKKFDITPLCGGVNRMGRACNKRAVRGHKHCVKHMSQEERIDYENNKRGAKFINEEIGADNGIRQR